MSGVDALRMLARGDRPCGALLPPCRLEGLGTRAYGEEAILHHFRVAPLDGLDAAQTVVSPSHIAIFAGDDALVADVFEERILRIWRLGPGEPLPAEPAMGVAFDTDLFQSRRDVAYRWEDHPQLQQIARGPLMEVGYRIAHTQELGDVRPSWRVRPFLLRAFSGQGSHAALFAVHRLGSSSVRSAGFSHAAAHFVAGEEAAKASRITRDMAGERAVERSPWNTRFP